MSVAKPEAASAGRSDQGSDVTTKMLFHSCYTGNCS